MNRERRYPRVQLSIENLPLLFVQNRRHRRTPLTIVNLSCGGAGFMCTHQFDVEEELEAMIMLPDFGPISCSGTIRFKQELWGLNNYGMEFEIDSRAREVIGKYLSIVSHGG